MVALLASTSSRPWFTQTLLDIVLNILMPLRQNALTVALVIFAVALLLGHRLDNVMLLMNSLITHLLQQSLLSMILPFSLHFLRGPSLSYGARKAQLAQHFLMLTPLLFFTNSGTTSNFIPFPFITFIYLLVPCGLRFARKPSHTLFGIASLESEGKPVGWSSL